MVRNKWYIGGLHFECVQCGNCCAGPGEGFIWITRPEIEILAKHLEITPGELRKKYMKRFFNRTSIVEHPRTKDCIFLKKTGPNTQGCAVYKARPNQCRTWPFWSSNLTSANAWNQAAKRCPGINRVKFHSFEQIEKIRKQKQWW